MTIPEYVRNLFKIAYYMVAGHADYEEAEDLVAIQYALEDDEWEWDYDMDIIELALTEE